MDFAEYLIEKMLILVPALYVIGMILKSTPKMKDWLIPWVLLVIGLVAAVAIGISTGTPVVDSVIQGVLVTGVTVYTNQLITQTTKKESE